MALRAQAASVRERALAIGSLQSMGKARRCFMLDQ